MPIYSVIFRDYSIYYVETHDTDNAVDIAQGEWVGDHFPILDEHDYKGCDPIGYAKRNNLIPPVKVINTHSSVRSHTRILYRPS